MVQFNTDITWPYQSIPYIVTGNISVYSTTSEPTLTIEPGVEVRFNGNYRVNIGYSYYNTYYNGILKAQGTASMPIIFTSNKNPANPGDWRGIRFYNHASIESILDYVTVEYGGYDYGAFYISDSSPIIKNSTIRYSNTYGIYITGDSSPIIMFSTLSNNTNYAVYSTVPVLKVNHSNITSNGNGIYSPTGKIADARFNWWGDVTGPSEEGPGTGQSVSSGIIFEPWLGTAYTYPFYNTDLSASVQEVNPLNSSVDYTFSISEDSNWTVSIKDSGGTDVKTFPPGSGTGGSVSWDGTDDSETPVADGTYTYQLSSTSLSDSSESAPLIGDVVVKEGLPIAKITYPVERQFFGNTLLDIQGTASDSDFDYYEVYYGLGTAPTSWTLITNSATPVTDGTLATLDLSGLTGTYYTIRLSVNDTSGNTATASVGININHDFEIKNLLVSNIYFSPDGDGFKDTTTITAQITYSSDWTVDIKNSGGSLVRTFTGTGTSVSAIWNGKDGEDEDPSAVPLSEGEYSYTITATEPSSGAIVSKDGTNNITIDNTPPDAVSDLAVADITFESVLLTWTAVADNGAVTGPAGSYDIRYSTEMITDTNWADATQANGELVPGVPGSAENFKVTGLSPLTTYYFAMKVADKGGLESGLSNVVSTMTPSPPVLEVNPTSIADTLIQGGISTHTLTLSNTGGDTLSYSISVIETANPEIAAQATSSSESTIEDAASSINIKDVLSNRSEKPQVIYRIPEGVEYVSDEIIVKFKDGIPPVKKKKVHDKHKSKKLKKFKRLGIEHVKLDPGFIVEEAIALYNTESDVEYAEPNYIYRTIGTPDDPRFDELWGLHNEGQTGGTADADIDAPEAWDFFRGSPDVVVAVIDTGADYTHEDLADNMWSNPGEIPDNGIDDDGNGYVDDYRGWDFYNSDKDPFDDNGHGTHCSGTIGAVGDNGIGVAGINWNLKIMPLKGFGSGGSSTTSILISAIIYASDMGVDVMSNSWGGVGYSQAMKDAIQAANDADILFVAAAGNTSNNNDTNPYYPATYDVPNVIAVAATDHNDGLAWFSSYGATTVDLGAPGVNIFSTFPPGAYLSSGCNDNDSDGYGLCSGTSMATPHVAGVAAFLKGYKPSITVDEIKTAIMDSVDPIDALAGKTVTGGRLNAIEALGLAGPAWLTIIGERSGEILPGFSIDLTIQLDARDRSLGDYGADIIIVSNDPVNSEVTVPVSMTVTGWQDSNWQYRQEITIDSSMAPSDQTNFPVLISVTDTDLKDTVNSGHVGLSDGGDILFTSSDGTIKLDHEIEKYDNITGELVAWVSIPSLSSSIDTSLYMYYGNSSAVNQENPAGVWDNGFVMVQHLEENPDSENHLDSTSYYNDGTPYNFSGGDTTGQIDGADDFAGDNDYINIPYNSSIDILDGNNPFTFDIWLKLDILPTDAGYSYQPFSQADGNGKGRSWIMIPHFDGGGALANEPHTHIGQGFGPPNVITSGTVLNADTWYMLTMVYDGTDLTWYTNGVAGNSAPRTPDEDGDGDYRVGSNKNALGSWFDGQIDEIRISNIARSADWIAASFNNQNNPGAYLIVAAEEELSVGSVQVNATLDGIDWTGSVNYTLSGLETINGTSTPATFSEKPIGTYTLTYTSGGPANSILSDISPSNTQTLIADGTITFTMNFLTVPAPPSNLTATTISSSRIDLSWTDGSNNETGFKIERKIGVGGTYSEIATVTANETNYSDTGLTPDTTYYYRVKAYNSNGDSGYSNEADAITLPLPPDVPSLFGATAISASRIDLSWTDNSNNETGFKIERKIGIDGTYSQIATVGADVTTYSDTGLTPETTYFYRVKAYNSGGDSAPSNEADATTMATVPPTATTDTVTNLNGNSATLNATVNPNGSDTTVYFEWGIDTSYGNSTIPQSIGSGIDDVSISADITGLSPNTTYHYRAVATNIAETVYGLDESFTTPPITLTITSPLDGETIYRPDVLVKGTVTNLTGNETGVTVNGIVATVYGSEFFVNHVPLEEGENIITATAVDTSASGGGNTATTYITVDAVISTPHVTLTANIESGIAPLTTYFSVSTSIPNAVATYDFDYEGDAVVDYTGATFEDISFTYTTEGVYYPTVIVTDDQSITYSDTIAIVVLNEAELDALLQAKWEAMKTALANQDVEGAVVEITENSKDMYRYNFELMIDILPTIVQDMADIIMQRAEDRVVEYKMNTVIEGTEYNFYIKFVKDLDGIWRIYFF